MRVIVVGAGVMGCATALALARRGVRDIVVLERAVPGAEASSAAAGMLAAQVESKSAEERASFVRAREAYAPWAEELRELGGVDIGYRRSGVLELAETEEALQDLTVRMHAHRSEGLRAEVVDAARARTIEPELGVRFAGAAWLPDEAQVDPPSLLRALAVAVARAGVVVRSGATVSSLVHAGDRCAGVELDGAEVLHGDAVVLAAGSWASSVPGLPSSLPTVRPVRGQLVMLEERPPRLSKIVFRGSSYVVPRGDGRVVCGSTMEEVGHRREVTADGVRTILASATAIAPALGEAALTRVWCNFRPYAEGGPLIGRSGVPGLFLATGHFRNGILLAKTTADLVADAVLA
ncbi:MAG TPA: glycine oxidase ThiO [Labilithrix sp.]|nr:glycine oxidase ThiO [Labilithrix sp.]